MTYIQWELDQVKPIHQNPNFSFCMTIRVILIPKFDKYYFECISRSNENPAYQAKNSMKDINQKRKLTQSLFPSSNSQNFHSLASSPSILIDMLVHLVLWNSTLSSHMICQSARCGLGICFFETPISAKENIKWIEVQILHHPTFLLKSYNYYQAGSC